MRGFQYCSLSLSVFARKRKIKPFFRSTPTIIIIRQRSLIFPFNSFPIMPFGYFYHRHPRDKMIALLSIKKKAIEWPTNLDILFSLIIYFILSHFSLALIYTSLTWFISIKHPLNIHTRAREQFSLKIIC